MASTSKASGSTSGQSSKGSTSGQSSATSGSKGASSMASGAGSSKGASSMASGAGSSKAGSGVSSGAGSSKAGSGISSGAGSSKGASSMTSGVGSSKAGSGISSGAGSSKGSSSMTSGAGSGVSSGAGSSTAGSSKKSSGASSRKSSASGRSTKSGSQSMASSQAGSSKSGSQSCGGSTKSGSQSMASSQAGSTKSGSQSMASSQAGSSSKSGSQSSGGSTKSGSQSMASSQAGSTKSGNTSMASSQAGSTKSGSQSMASSQAGSTKSGNTSMASSQGGSTKAGSQSKFSGTTGIMSNSLIGGTKTFDKSRSSDRISTKKSSLKFSSGHTTKSGSSLKTSNTSSRRPTLIRKTLSGSRSSASSTKSKSSKKSSHSRNSSSRSTPASRSSSHSTNSSSHSSQSSSGHSSSSASSSRSFGSSRFSHESSSVPDRPKLAERLKDLQHTRGYIEVKSMDEMKAMGYTVGELIVTDDVYRFHAGRKGKDQILCKVIELDKCSPRYRSNLLEFSLKISRFIGNPPQNKHFIRIYEQFKLKNEIYIFLEECINKSLYLILLDRDPFTPEEERRWTSQICKAIGKMQELGLAHRFLKLQHILFDSHRNVKVVGWSKAVPFWDPDHHEALYQNPERRSRKNGHLPPECFRGIYDPSKVDMWSLGVMMVCMQTKAYPFNVRSSAKFSAQWRQFSVLHEMNRYCRAAINKTFSIDPKRRAKPHEFLELPYFKTSSSNIQLKQLKITVDPKYDPNMTVEKAIPVSQAFSEVAQSKRTPSQGSGTGGGGSAAPPMDQDPEPDDALDQGDENASGVEGGQIGSEVPQSERQYESAAQESCAPEEQANQAAPVMASQLAGV